MSTDVLWRFELSSLDLGQRLTEFYSQSTKNWQNAFVDKINRKGGDERLQQTVRNELDSLVLFSIEFAVLTTMVRPKAQQFLEHVTMAAGPSRERVKHYYE